jgi:hypothetical protein
MSSCVNDQEDDVAIDVYLQIDAFGTPDPDDECDHTVPAPILRELARDLVVQTVRASGGPDRLRAEIKNQRIDFDALPPDIQRAFRPYFFTLK